MGTVTTRSYWFELFGRVQSTALSDNCQRRQEVNSGYEDAHCRYLAHHFCDAVTSSNASKVELAMHFENIR